MSSVTLRLATCAIALEGFYLGLLRLDAVNGLRPLLLFLATMAAAFAVYGVASRIVLTRPAASSAPLATILVCAALFRVTLLPAGLPPDRSWPERFTAMADDLAGRDVVYERFLLFDNDVWRYLWDGHVSAHGRNPFSSAPAANTLDVLADTALPGEASEIWSEIRGRINHPGIPTIYPPLAQGLFRLAHAAAPGSIVALKLWVVACDLIACLLIAGALRATGQPPDRVVLYAWNPLVVKVFAGSAHVDALLVLALAGLAWAVAADRPVVSGALLGASVLAKLGPVVLAPFVIRRTGASGAAVCVAVVLAGYVPFADAGLGVFEGLAAFAGRWQFNAGPYWLIQSLASWLTPRPQAVARLASALLLAGVIGWLAWRDRRNAPFHVPAAWALGALVVLSPAVMPWYVSWLIPLAILARQWVWIHFSALVLLAFVVIVDGREQAWAQWIEYGLLGVFLMNETRRGTTAPRSGPETAHPGSGA